MASMKPFLVLFICITFLTLSHGSKLDDLEEDVAFLESQEINDSQQSNQNSENFGSDLHDVETHQDQLSWPSIDEKDVIILKKENFSGFIEKNRYVLVEFYAPWCSHCRALAPGYAAAATELKGEVVLAKVDGTQEEEMLQKFDIEGFPTLLFFVDGVHKTFEGDRTKDGIVTWVKKKTGAPSIYNITTTEEAKSILAAESTTVLGFLDSLVGPVSEELVAASRLQDDVKFYKTSNPDVAKLFNIEPLAKRPAMVLLKKEDEKLSYFDGPFSKLAISEFVSNNKLPLVVTLTSQTAKLVFGNSIKKHLLLFANSHDSEKIKAAFLEAAKSFKGKLTFVYVELDHQDTEKRVLEYFSVSGDSPRVLAFRYDDDKKYVMNGDLTFSNIKSFVEEFLEDKLKPFYISDPIPDKNDGDVKIVVGKNFDEIVLDGSKDVLLEIYAPWCSHWQALEPIYNRLGKYLRGIESLVIAKMDGTTNEHFRVKVDGFPTLLFFPAGNKSSDPIDVETDHSVVALYKFLRNHATIPFKLQKPAASTESIINQSGSDDQKMSNDMNLKDEL
ncbi:Thioredoxin [Corchorus olitorius]|uniref:protein disulfide-isomerase n=1 Tax=Corchorus olitorius TaxID=93759 RepID=A0A1R3IFE7_9ROSI|nr:Thioredoxin [Corchorus olitorius]